jgi:hypothetical protein
VIGAQNGYARDWLESRLTSTIMRLLAVNYHIFPLLISSINR